MTKINLDFDLWGCTAVAEDIAKNAKLDHCTIVIKSKNYKFTKNDMDHRGF